MSLLNFMAEHQLGLTLVLLQTKLFYHQLALNNLFLEKEDSQQKLVNQLPVQS